MLFTPRWWRRRFLLPGVWPGAPRRRPNPLRNRKRSHSRPRLSRATAPRTKRPPPAAGGVATPSSAEALQVVGTQLCDQAGNPVQLRGVSTHGLAWYPGYVNPAFFTELRRDWNANVVRLALYTAENGGWRDELYNLVRDRMAAAVRAGLPVFVSEFGICDASGNGTIDRTSADAWVAAMNELGISYACWNLSNKDEASRCSKARAAKRRASPPTTCPKKAPGCGTCFMAKAKAPQAQQAR